VHDARDDCAVNPVLPAARNERLALAPIMPPATRVSAIRHGVIGVNCASVDGSIAACGSFARRPG
jgi:hypothetical protein